MTHAPEFWARKLITDMQRVAFWCLVNEWRFSGETAYYKALNGEKPYARA